MSKVLVVEDDPMLRFVVSEVLRDGKIDVIEAHTADEALHRLKSNNTIKLVFSDINMPGRLDGLTLAQVIKTDYPTVKIILTSGRPQSPDVLDGLKFVPKPYLVYDLLDLIRESVDA